MSFKNKDFVLKVSIHRCYELIHNTYESTHPCLESTPIERFFKIAILASNYQYIGGVDRYIVSMSRLSHV